MRINARYKRVKYMLKRRADGEEEKGRGGKEAIIINSIKVVIVIAVYTSLLITL